MSALGQKQTFAVQKIVSTICQWRTFFRPQAFEFPPGSLQINDQADRARHLRIATPSFATNKVHPEYEDVA